MKAISEFISVFGIPKVIQTDHGSNFTSRLFFQVLKQPNVTHNISTAYHPQSQGALERFHQHLKSLLHAYCTELKADWQDGLPWLLLAAREVVQESTGFSPNELYFAHTIRGPLYVIRDQWVTSDPLKKLISYVNGFRNRLYEAGELAKQNLQMAQKKKKQLFDRKVEQREFCAGGQVLMLQALTESPFQAKFFSPSNVIRRVSEQDHLCHSSVIQPSVIFH